MLLKRVLAFETENSYMDLKVSYIHAHAWNTNFSQKKQHESKFGWSLIMNIQGL